MQSYNFERTIKTVNSSSNTQFKYITNSDRQIVLILLRIPLQKCCSYREPKLNFDLTIYQSYHLEQILIEIFMIYYCQITVTLEIILRTCHHVMLTNQEK